MNKWFKVVICDKDGAREGMEFVKAATEQDAKNIIVENWCDYPYVDDAEDYSLEVESMTFKDEDKCAHIDEVERFMMDGCTKNEAEHYIAKGGFSVPAVEWNAYAEENDWQDDDGNVLTLDKVKAHGDCISRVEVDGEEFVLLYVL